MSRYVIKRLAPLPNEWTGLGHYVIKRLAPLLIERLAPLPNEAAWPAL